MLLPYLETGYLKINRAFRLALGDLTGNVIPFEDGLLQTKAPAIMAGLDYNTPWTRDTAINTWNGAGLIMPEVALNTLLSVLEKTKETGEVRIGGQYWDAIIWTQGAWAYYLYTGDKEFLGLALEAVKNSLKWFEATEFDSQTGLFRGPACYGDGIAAYPDRYAKTGGSSFILDWAKANPADAAKTGVGMPMQVLSTNCLYQNAYVLAGKMAAELGIAAPQSWIRKAEVLKQAIQKQLWSKELGRFRYFTDPWGGCDREEGLGHSFALMFGIVDAEQAESIFSKVHVTEYGIPCVWPTYERYTEPGGDIFGRHSGTVWPHVQGFWAEAAARYHKAEILRKEMLALAENACRDGQFTEIYHPLTGLPTGGRQEHRGPMRDWPPKDRQTWSATAFIRMILMGLIGMRFEPSGIVFDPCAPSDFKKLSLSQLRYRRMELEIEMTGPGNKIVEFSVDGNPSGTPRLSAEGTGSRSISIELG